jgi:hypothetical protein
MRMAMDVIMRDVASAGVGFPSPSGNFIQVFTQGLGGVGPLTGSGGALTDDLEILTNTSGFQNVPACTDGSANNTSIFLKPANTSIVVGSDVMVFFANGTWKIRTVTAIAPNSVAPAPCTAGTHFGLTLNADPAATGGLGTGGSTRLAPPVCSTSPCLVVTEIGMGSVVRYGVRAGTGGIPNLERTENGGTPQILATGIEDLQVEYVQADGTVSQTAPAVTNNDNPDNWGVHTTLITQVRVSLSARSQSSRIQGATTNASAGVALRGSMLSQASPRQALWVLTEEKPAPSPPRWN